MLKTKYVLSALSFLVAMTMATSAFAQVTFTVGSSIESRARMNGQTELAGGITLTRASGSTTAIGEGSVTINFGTTITNSVGTRAGIGDDVPANTIGVEICGTLGQEGMTGNVARSGSTLTITVDGITCGDGTVIDVSGVRLAIAGQGLSDVSANITSSGEVRLASGSNEVTVIDNIVDELTDRGVTADKVTLIRHTALPEDEEYFKLMIAENAVDSFEDAQINLDFSGLGTGMSIVLDAWVTTTAGLRTLAATELVTSGCQPVAADAVVPTDHPNGRCVLTNSQLAFSGGDMSDMRNVTVNSMNTEAVVLTSGLGSSIADADDATDGIQVDIGGTNYNVSGGSLSDSAVNVIVVRGKITVDTRPPPPAVALPLGDVNIMATADVGPIGRATCIGSQALCTEVPRFASEESHAVTVIDVTSDQTMLRIPFAAVIGDSWDTGIAIANTNTDSDQMGGITFNFFQGGESMDPFTPDGSTVGNGLNDDGMLEAGGTYSVQLSDVLEAAGHPASFSGYVEITTDFTNAKGFVFLSSFAGGAWGAAGAVDDITDE